MDLVVAVFYLLVSEFVVLVVAVFYLVKTNLVDLVIAIFHFAILMLEKLQSALEKINQPESN